MIAGGDTSTLTFTIAIAAGGPAAEDLTFTNDLPAGVVVADPANATTTCTGGAVTATPADGTIAFSGGPVAAGATCTASVTVTSSTAGAQVNTSGDLTSSLGNSGAAAATLTVTETTFSVPPAIGGGTISGGISSAVAGCEIVSVAATTPEALAGGGPAGASFPYGLIDLQIDGCSPGSTVTFSIVFPSALPPGAVYWKYGPTPTDSTPHWYTLPATILGDTVTYTITDGGLGDDDLSANGVIADPGGPGVALAPVPVMPAWMLLMLGLVMTAWAWVTRWPARGGP